jgi:FdhD protein
MDELQAVKSYNFKSYNDGEWVEKIGKVSIEKTFNIFINIRKIASLLCSPLDLRELAAGFLISEGIIDSLDLIKKIEVKGTNIIASSDTFQPDIEYWMEVRSSGCVGIQKSWENLIKPIQSNIEINPEIIFKSQKLLRDKNVIWRETGGTHAAGIFSASGKLLAFSEDIGRHNAIDKVIGKLYLKKIDPSSVFLATTGRQSVGMVAKVARAKIPIIVSNTAPLDQGIDLARKLKMKLICFSREPKLNLY